MDRPGARWIAALVAVAVLSGAACTSRPRPQPKLSPSIKSGGTLTLGVREIGSLDPAKSSWLGAGAVLAQLFTPLVTLDPTTSVLRPGAARSWRVSPDGTTWVFALGSTRFFDGSKVTAADFKFAFDRVTARATGSDLAFQLQSVAGFKAWHDEAQGRGLAGVTAPSPTQLTVTLVAPFSDLPYVLANPRFGPLGARRYARGTASVATKPVGNGSFRVGSLRAGQRLRLIRNPHAVSIGHVDAIDFHATEGLDAGWREFKQGVLDVVEVPPAVIDEGMDAADEAGRTPLWATLSFGFNLRLQKFKNIAVRRALSHAINREAIARTVYSGTKEPATGILPQGMRGFEPDRCAYCRFERGLAGRILQNQLQGQILTVALDHLNDATSRRVAAAVASDLNAVGVRTQLRPHTRAEYVAFLQRGKHELAQLGWISDTPTPDGFLAEQLGSRSPNNQTGFADATFDGAISRARAEAREPQRLAAYRAAESRALDQLPLMPIVFFRNRIAIATRVHELVLNGAGVFDGSKVWLS